MLLEWLRVVTDKLTCKADSPLSAREVDAAVRYSVDALRMIANLEAYRDVKLTRNAGSLRAHLNSLHPQLLFVLQMLYPSLDGVRELSHEEYEVMVRVAVTEVIRLRQHCLRETAHLAVSLAYLSGAQDRVLSRPSLAALAEPTREAVV